MIRQRGPSTFQIVVYLGPDPETGRERRHRQTFHGTKRKAEDLERALILQARRGELGTIAEERDDRDRTVAELLAAWLDHARPDLALKTAYNYQALIDQRIVPALGNLRLERLTAAHLDRFYAGLRAELAPKTIRNIHAILRRALTQAQRWGWISTNPATLASPPRVERPDIVPPAREDVAAFLAHTLLIDPDDGTLYWLAAVTGARRGELCGLRWTDLDTDAGTLLIQRAVVQVGGETVVKDTKTHQARRIALDGATLELLAQHRARAIDTADAAGITFITDTWIFTNPKTGSHLHPDTITARYRAHCQAHRQAVAAELAEALDIPIDDALTKVPELGRLHDLRHFAATQALAAGIPVRTVAGRLGHANPATTHNVYAHFLEASDRAAAEVLGALAAGT